ncbi:hypothetical protein [Modicisalibacter luteus]|jgi:hypothetical protein|uniref:Uncharacterized protein n=1 Tax=Modicisalibacter luteus TaxID=453962 RepID=A0ABV7LXC6_9GAMM|nr:hypothetical protein [Halomonas lutea]GHB12892.1 hypothetical protein GCM10007159_38990 [Halomonas lutea]
MFFFLIHARPQPGAPSPENISEAMVKVWVNSEDYQIAEAAAVQRISRRRWQVIAIEDAIDYGESLPQGLNSAQTRLYNDALIGGIATLYRYSYID